MDDIATLERPTGDSKTPLKLTAPCSSYRRRGRGPLPTASFAQPRTGGRRRLRGHGSGSVGGTWYWNRYPRRSLGFWNRLLTSTSSPGVVRGWDWSERFSAQPEIERWLQYVTDRLDLRKDIPNSTPQSRARISTKRQDRWSITTDKGHVIDAAFLSHLLRQHAVGARSRPFFRDRRRSRAVVPHRTLAEGPGRFGRQARRRGRHRRDGDPGCSNHCRQGRSPDSIRPHSAVRNSDEEPEILRQPIRRRTSRSSAESLSKCRTHSAALRSTSRTSGLRRRRSSAAPVLEEIYQDGFAQVLDRVLRGTLPRPGG